MAWKYEQQTGRLTNPSGNFVGLGYSGRGEGLNNPAMQQVKDVGPIPRGKWSIGRFVDDLGGKGMIVAHLTPAPETETYGRAGFMVHGDNKAANHTASEGCIVLWRLLREMMMASNDRVLIVVA
jgi:hypothetical protein